MEKLASELYNIAISKAGFKSVAVNGSKMLVAKDADHASDYNLVIKYVQDNISNFSEVDKPAPKKIFGKIDGSGVSIVSHVFTSFCNSNNIDRSKFLVWAAKMGIIKFAIGRKVLQKRINGSLMWCVHFVKLSDFI